DAGAGRLGKYRGASWSTTGVGRFTPLEGSTPAIGAVGVPADVPENKIEILGPREIARSVVEAGIAAHPYEEPAYIVTDVSMLEDLFSVIGTCLGTSLLRCCCISLPTAAISNSVYTAVRSGLNT